MLKGTHVLRKVLLGNSRNKKGNCNFGSYFPRGSSWRRREEDAIFCLLSWNPKHKKDTLRPSHKEEEEEKGGGATHGRRRRRLRRSWKVV